MPPPRFGSRLTLPACLTLTCNLDEVAATAMLLECLERMGWRVLPG
jgi:hypothetical protein